MLYIEELKELNKGASAWAFVPETYEENPNYLTVEGLRSWLAGCIVYFFHYGDNSARDLVKCFAWCSAGLWFCGDSDQAKALTLPNGYRIKSARLTKAGAPILELWNDAEKVKLFRD